MGKKAKKANSSEYVLVDGEDIPLKDHKFDKILNPDENLFDVDENLKQSPNVEEMIAFLNRESKKGGKK